jgi:hypothetical protein
MSVDFYWRRVRGDALHEASPRQLRAMVPHCSDGEFDALRKADEAMLVERHHAVMDFLLKEGGTHDARPNALPVFGGERHTEDDVGRGRFEVDVWVLDPPSVREGAEFLSAFRVSERMDALEAELAEEIRALHFGSPWDAEWQAEVRDDLLRLTSFFAAAAEAGDAMIKVEEDGGTSLDRV